MTIRYEPEALNVLGGELAPCSARPVTGFFRNGCCETGPEDTGMHTVCAVMTAEFLAFSQSVGNDLTTPVPDYGFPGLKPGDRIAFTLEMRWQDPTDVARIARIDRLPEGTPLAWDPPPGDAAKTPAGTPP